MLTDVCQNCGEPIYHGTRRKTFEQRSKDPSRRLKRWRHVDTEHEKCAGPIPQATPIRHAYWQPDTSP